MYYVYILKSINFPEIIYAGSTSDVQSRLDVHNSGGSVYTKDYKPWKLLWQSQFEDKLQVLEFEKYLKSHSGRAFMHKRLLSL